MLRLRGEIDFDALARLEIRPVVDGDLSSVDVPGLRLTWDRRHADFATDGGALAIAIGRARDAGHRTAGQAAQWLERYRRHGQLAANEVGGGFAAVVIDMAAGEASAWVDRFAIESLCYRSTSTRFAFSDRAIDVSGSKRVIARQALFDYLYYHEIPAPRTIYEDVQRLPAAHGLRARRASIRVTRYWNPQFIENDATKQAERMREFVELVRRAVEEEADDASTACFLSGGTDSSTVAGMLTRVRGTPAAAYSIGFQADGYDEMAYARIAARHFGLAHHEYYVTPDNLVEAIPRVAASLDQPFGNSSVLPTYFCALRAREDGFTRMLAGDGGDELFGGNTRYAVQRGFELYHALPLALRANVIEPLASLAPFRKVPGLRQLGGYVRHARPDMPDRLNAFNLLYFIGLDRVLDPDFLRCVDADDPIAQQRRAWNEIPAQSLVNRMLAYDWKFTLADNDLPKVRAATQLVGTSVGYPFLSRELADFSLRLPPNWKVRGHKLRWFFKQALRDFLPRDIIRKKKHGFGLPFGPWLLRHDGLRDLAADALLGIESRGIVRRGLARELLENLLTRSSGFYGELVWILVMLELWMRAARHDVYRNPTVPRSVLDEVSR